MWKNKLNINWIKHFMIIRHIRLDRSHFSIFISLEVFGVEMGRSVLNAKSKSIQPRTISTASFQTLKFVPFSIGIEFTWAVTFAALTILTKERKNEIGRQRRLTSQSENWPSMSLFITRGIHDLLFTLFIYFYYFIKKETLFYSPSNE